MKKLGALLLSVAILLSLSTCSFQNKAVGEWRGEMDLSDAMRNSMNIDELEEYVTFEDLTIELIMTFDKDGEYSLEIDEDSAEEMVEKLIDAFVDGMIESFEDEGLTLEDIGITKNDIRQQFESSLDFSEIIDDLEREGVYFVDDDVIYFSEDDLDALKDDPEDECDGFLEVAFNGNKMEIQDWVQDGESIEDVMDGVMPIVMKKQ